MKLAHPSWNFQIEFTEGRICQLIIEDRNSFREMISQMYLQILTGDGDYVLAEGNRTADFSKSIEINVDPFNIEMNSRKIVSGVHESICNLVNDSDMYMDACRIYSEIESLISGAEDMIMYPLDWQADVDFYKFLKLFDVKLKSQECTLAEKLINYVTLMQEFTKIECFVFINLKDYFSKEILETVSEQWIYQKAKVLLIESGEKYALSNEKTWIIDKDLCEIY